MVIFFIAEKKNRSDLDIFCGDFELNPSGNTGLES